MNALFVTNILTPYQIDLAVELNKYCNYMVCYNKEKEKNRDWLLGISDIKDHFIYCPFQKDFQLLLEKSSFDVVIIGGYSHLFTSTTVFFCKERNVPILLWLELPNRNFPFALQLKSFLLKLQGTLNNYDAIIAIGERAQKFYKNIFLKKSLVFNVPYSLNLKKFLNIKRKKREKVTFLFAGQLIKRKNIFNILRAFVKLKEKYPQLKLEFTVCGSGPLESFVKKCREYDVRYLGFVQPTDLPRIYGDADIFLLPSLDDGWGVVINEAMASAMPVITSKYVGAAVEYIVSYKNGFIVNRNTYAIYNAMKFYVDNLDEILIHGQRNREIILNSNGNVELAAKDFFKIFNIMVNKNNLKIEK